jgi:predicted metal-dependent HD superfamily phosphohydrolase
MVDEPGGHACLRGDRGDGGAAATVRAENASESPHDLRSTAIPKARAPHRLVVPPIYAPQLWCMDVPLPAHLVEWLEWLEWPATMLERLSHRYAEAHRHYHTWTHVLACLEGRRRLTTATLPDVDLALLFHDAIYEPLARDNESRSAELLLEEGRRAWIDERTLQRAKTLVEATAHHAAALVDSEEACIVIDADLSILGAEPSAFDRYERAVREEFARVDDSMYVAGRMALLRAFLERPSIYLTRRAHRLWESDARRNLERSIAKLSSSVSTARDHGVVRT